MVSLSQFFLELIKQKLVFLFSALSVVWDCPFNLLEFIWMLFLLLLLDFVILDQWGFIPLP
jgi:hypothetical protein